MITPFVHQCVSPDTGNKHSSEVEQWEIEHQEKCYVCDEIKAPLTAIVAHIYSELTS